MNPVLELSIGACCAVAALYFVLRPILNPATVTAADTDAAFGQEGEEPGEDLSPRAVALRALKEIEFDRATGKLSDPDYQALKGQYTAEALVALRVEDQAAAGEKRERKAESRSAAPRSPVSAPVCPTHGKRPESDAQFCSECGRRLESPASGVCARCGSPLEKGAQFCSSCGRAVAA
ncbi:MAG TPA: zinc ribbon domain-containing protein [Gemmatimonadales bacterium]|nr:zinc ribbon domain-containing protein [Gemmatimonadales bacterium]